MTRLVGYMLASCFVLGTVLAEAQEKQWMAVMVNGKKVGYYKKQRIANADSVITTELMAYEIDAGTDKIDLLSVNETVETTTGKLMRFRKESIQNDVKRRLVGQVVGDTLHVAGLVNDKKSIDMMSWPEDVVMIEGRRLLALKHGLKPGTKYHPRQFMVDFMAIADVVIEVGERSDVQIFDQVEQLTEIREVLRVRGQALSTLMYINDQMRTMKAIIPQLSMEMIDCNEVYAMTPPE